MPEPNKLSKEDRIKIVEFYSRGDSINKIASSFNVNRQTIQYHLRDIRNFHFTRNMFEVIPSEITEDVAECAGIIFGDGTMWKEKNRGFRIRIRGDPKNEKRYYDNWVKPLFERTFNIKVFPKNFNGGTYGIEVNSKKIVNFFVDIFKLPLGKKALTIEFPKCLMNAERKVKLAFLRGLIDTDGFMYFNTLDRKERPGLRFRTLYFGLGLSSQKIIEQLKQMLEEFGYNTSKITISRGSPFTDNPEFNLRLCGITNFNLYLNEIGTNNSRFESKLNKIQEIMANG